MLVTILIFIVILGLLVFVHELGHFLVAKKSGMKVEEFGFGFPPRLAGIQRLKGKFIFVWGHKAPKDPGQTVYSINWIPLGGFVKIVGENNESESDPQSFINKPFFPRLLTLVAGVLMNVLLAWVLLSIGLMRGLPAEIGNSPELKHGATVSNVQVVVSEVKPGYPAEAAGVRPNDIVLGLNEKNVTTVSEVQEVIRANPGKEINFRIKRGSEELATTVTPLSNPPEGTGPTGIALTSIGHLKYPPHWAAVEGAIATGNGLWAIVSGLYSLFASGQGFDSLGGPAKIAQLTGQVADMGFSYLIQFTAFLSLNLAILNILPFPALDGGRVLFLFIEKIRGKRNNQYFEQLANTAGFLLLLLLMVFVTINDIRGFGGIGTVVRKLFGQ